MPSQEGFRLWVRTLFTGGVLLSATTGISTYLISGSSILSQGVSAAVLAFAIFGLMGPDTGSAMSRRLAVLSLGVALCTGAAVITFSWWKNPWASLLLGFIVAPILIPILVAALAHPVERFTRRSRRGRGKGLRGAPTKTSLPTVEPAAKTHPVTRGSSTSSVPPQKSHSSKDAIAGGGFELPVSSGASRALRFFISSTFGDMEAERDELVKFVLPRVRKMCEDRGVVFGEVDLRWGITDEQKAEGQVLPICLAEIERTRPYFIGLLGERYGWVPERIPGEVVEREEWLAGMSGRSVTELEILHGVLNNPDMAGHAFFYFRDPRYVDALPESQRAPFVEATREGREKLRALKDRVRESGFPVREDYPNPRGLGELVAADLTALVDALFPEGSTPSPLERERAEHNAFAATRTGVYVCRQAYMDVLDTHATDSGGQPLLVVGESGSGKSALLANWARRHEQDHPNRIVVTHFVGGSTGSANWQAMVRRLIGELAARFGFEVEIPTEPDLLRQKFAETLARADARGGAVLVVDALNQLEDREGALELRWLPEILPREIRLVASTLPGKALEAAAGRGWPKLEVEPLVQVERRRLTVELLAQSTKALSPALVDKITAAPQTSSPLFLRVLLEELRVFGSHEQLPDRIDRYLRAADTPELFEHVLARYETDFERDRLHLVRDAFSLLWAGRHGLTEAELLDLLGSGGRLPHAVWTPLLLTAESNLLNRSGVLSFSHHHLRDAIQRRYLRTAAEQAAAHRVLAGFFDSPERRYTPRAVDELPWQLTQSENLRRLSGLLADLRFFQPAWTSHQFDMKRFWALVDPDSKSIPEAYSAVLDEPAIATPAQIQAIAHLLADTGHPAKALTLWSWLVCHYRTTNDLPHLQEALGESGTLLHQLGRTDEAGAMWKSQELACQAIGNVAGLVKALDAQVFTHLAKGDRRTARALLDKAEKACSELDDDTALVEILNTRAAMSMDEGDLTGALDRLKRMQKLSLELGMLSALQESLGNQAIIQQSRNNLEEALRLLDDQERICRQLGARLFLQMCLCNKGTIMQDLGRLDEALSLHQEEERICRSIGNPNGLQACLYNQAIVLHRRGDPTRALALLEEQETLCRTLGDVNSLTKGISFQAEILGGHAIQLAKQHREPEAAHFAERALSRCVEAGLSGPATTMRNLIRAIEQNRRF